MMPRLKGAGNASRRVSTSPPIPSKTFQWLLLGLLLPLLLPLNGIALALGNPTGLHGLYFLMPLSLLGVLAVLLAWPVQRAGGSQ